MDLETYIQKTLGFKFFIDDADSDKYTLLEDLEMCMVQIVDLAIEREDDMIENKWLRYYVNILRMSLDDIDNIDWHVGKSENSSMTRAEWERVGRRERIDYVFNDRGQMLGEYKSVEDAWIGICEEIHGKGECVDLVGMFNKIYRRNIVKKCKEMLF